MTVKPNNKIKNKQSFKLSKNKIKNKRKYATDICNDTMTFQDCELAILRNAVDEGDQIKGKRLLNMKGVNNIIAVVEQFLKSKSVICYDHG